MTPSTLKKRLEDQAKKFKYETDYVKDKFRDLYRVAQDAVKLSEALDLKLQAYMAPTLDQQSAQEPITLPKIEPVSKAERIKQFLEGDHNDPHFQRFLKLNNMTIQDAQIYLENPNWMR